MKKTLLFATGLIATASLSAQITITSADFPTPGDQAFVTVDTVPNAGISVGQPGPNGTYDLTDINLDNEEITNFVEPSTLPNASEFPKATIATGGGGFEVYLKVGATEYDFQGVVVPNQAGGTEPWVIKYDDPQIFVTFPSTYQTAFVDDFYGQETFYVGMDFQGTQIDSGRITFTGTTDAEFDGFGTLSTPAGTFSDVLRQRAELTETQVIEVCINPGIPGLPCQWTEFQRNTEFSVEYTFYGKQSKMPLGSATYNAAEDTLQEVSINSDPTLTSIEEFGALVEGGIFPNPTQDVVNFKSEVTAAYLIDNAGRKIAIEVRNNTADLSTIEAGVYPIIATTKTGELERHPVVVSK